MERPSSRAGMHPEKEGRRSYMNGGMQTKLKSKSPLISSYSSLLNNNRSPYLDRNLNCSDPYMGPTVGNYSQLMAMDSFIHHPRTSCLPTSFYNDGFSYQPKIPAAESISLPVYPWQLPYKPRPKQPLWDVWSSAYAPQRPSEFSRANTNNPVPWPQNDEDFSSLPPIINDVKAHVTTAHPGQRRFSDPGLAVPSGPDQSNGSSSSDESDVGAQSSLIQRMLLEMNTLRETNVRLTQELEDTRAQLELMRRQQASSWRRMGSDYQPGMLADMVREVREATRIREEAMASRLRHAVSSDLESPILLESSLQHRRLSESSQRPQSSSQQSRHSDERRRGRRRQHGSLPRASSDDDEAGSSVSANSSRRSADMSALIEQVHQLKLDKQQLMDEVRQSRDSRAESDMHAQKLERLVGILRKKISQINGMQEMAGNLLQSPQTSIADVNGPASLQSLTSSSSAGSSLDPPLTFTPNAPITTISPQVTIHGPVTNL